MPKNDNSTSIKESDFFQSIADTIHQITSLPVSIWAPDQSMTILTIVAAVGLPANYIRTASLDLSQPSFAGEAFKKKKIQFAKDILSDPRWYYKEVAQEMNWKSAICVPIEADKKAIGVISVYAYRERSISDLAYILSAFAKQISLTIEADRQNEILQHILYTGEKIQSMTASLRDVLDTIVRSTCELTGADCAVIYPYDAEHDEFYDIENIASYGLQEPLHLTEKPRVQDRITAYIARKGEVIISNTEKEDSTILSTNSFVRKERIQAFIGVSLKVENVVIGVLFVNFRSPHTFTDNEKDTIRLFAHQAAIAVNNAKLYQNVRFRIEALEKLHEVGLTIASLPSAPGGLRDTLMSIAQSAKKVLDADLVDLYQYVQSRDWYDIRPIQVGERYNKFTIKKIQEDDVIWKIVRGRRPVYTADSQNSKVLASPFTEKRPNAPEKRFVIREDIKSSAAIPLMAGDEVLGVLFANYRTSQVFNQEQKRLIELFASQAAIAIRNTRILIRQKELVEFGEALTSSITRLTEKQVLELVHDQASELRETSNMYIALYDEISDTVRFPLVYVNGRRIDTTNEDGWQPRKAGMGKTEEIIKTKEPIFHTTKEQSEMWYARSGHEEYVGEPLASWIGVPMVVGDKVLGVIATYHPTEEYVYGGDDLTILQAMANQAAVALDSARSFEKAQKRIRDQETINNIAQAISMKVGTNDLLQTIVTQIQENLDCTHCAIFLPEKLGNEVTLVSEYAQGEFVERIKSRRFKPGEGIAGWVFEHGETVIIPDTLQDKRYVPIRAGGRVSHSLMAVPVKMNAETVGVISVDHNGIDKFDEDDCRLVETVAEHVAIAIEKGRAYEEIDKLYQEARSEAIANRQLATLGTAIAALQHRINNTLNLVPPNVTRLRYHLSSENDPEIEEILGIIDRNARYTSTLLSRIQTPLQEVGVVSVDVNATLTDIFNRLKKEWTTRTQENFSTELTLDSNIPIISLPIGQISEVFSNLIDNAYRALDKTYQKDPNSLKSAKIMVTTKLSKDDTIKVQVTDNVPGGIPLSIREKLFDKPVPSRTPGEGSGLGLWLSKLIMQRIGGDIIIEKTGEEGTTMLVEIPLA